MIQKWVNDYQFDNKIEIDPFLDNFPKGQTETFLMSFSGGPEVDLTVKILLNLN